MDDYGFGKPELNGALMSLEFGTGGRIQQLWVMDPNAPEENEEFQFVAPPLPMGEEFAEDYFPGTILLGARTDPDEPWIVSRNARAEQIGDDEDPSTVVFRYEFSFLEELEATGRFYEVPGRMPQIVWELTIRNRSRRSVEIGELGFPLALNNVLDGFPRDDRGTREMFHDRTHVHKFIGGSASYIYAQRMHGLPPGLLIFPGGDTKWEFYNHVPASLNTGYQWDGVPVVYVHSRAAIEREEWPEWFYGHTSTVLEPGDTRRYEMHFAPVDRFVTEGLSAALAGMGRPAMKLWPSAVAPINSSITLEVSGATPTRFWNDQNLEFESDSDEEGGSCVISMSEPGSVRVGFEDTAGREGETQVLFTPPISDLIVSRASWLMDYQRVTEGDMAGAFVSADNETGDRYTDPRHFTTPFTLKVGIGEALFLAEKNTIYFDQEQVEALDEYLLFFERHVRNPATGSVGCLLGPNGGFATCFGYPDVYPLTTMLYASMAKIARIFGKTARSECEYLEFGLDTALAIWPNALRDQLVEGAIPLMSYMDGFCDQLATAGLKDGAETLRSKVHHRWDQLSKQKYPFAPGGLWHAEGFEEALAAARHTDNLTLKERIFRCLMAGKSTSPNWWSYGSDKRWGPGTDGNDAALDNGELCLGVPSAMNSSLLLSLFRRDFSFVPDAVIRMAFAGMLGIWALVREDGAAGMAFCPDEASAHFGMSSGTGDLGIGLYHYLRATGAYVLPMAGSVPVLFGCDLEIDLVDDIEQFRIRPWDGVGRRIVVRQIGIEIETTVGKIVELRFDASKRWAQIVLENQMRFEVNSVVTVRGLWGKTCIVDGHEYETANGEFHLPVKLTALDTMRIDIEVKQ